MPMKRRRYRRRRRTSFKRLVIGAIILLALLLIALSIWLVSLLTKSDKNSGAEVPDSSVNDMVEDTGETIEATFPVTSEGWFILNDHAYYGTADGKLFVGVHTIEGTKYTFGEDGVLSDGWMQVGNRRYHFKNGVMSKGPTEINGKVYDINSDGSMFVGWYDAANGYRLYYDLETGDAFTGWHEIDGKHYCFDTNGFLYTDTTADGVPVDVNGVADEAAYQAYIGNRPAVTTPTTKPTSSQNTTDMETLNKQLDTILEKYGRTPKAIYDYVHDRYTYKNAKEGTIEENAAYLLENGTGSCYHFASLTYMLFKRAGYETHYVTGLGWQNHTYHCWVLAKFDGGWYYVDSLYVRSAKLTAADLKRIGYEWDESAYPA